MAAALGEDEDRRPAGPRPFAVVPAAVVAPPRPSRRRTTPALARRRRCRCARERWTGFSRPPIRRSARGGGAGELRPRRRHHRRCDGQGRRPHPDVDRARTGRVDLRRRLVLGARSRSRSRSYRSTPGRAEVRRQIASPIDAPGPLRRRRRTTCGSPTTPNPCSRGSTSGAARRSPATTSRHRGSGGVVVADGSLWVARRDADGLASASSSASTPPPARSQHLFHRLPGFVRARLRRRRGGVDSRDVRRCQPHRPCDRTRSRRSTSAAATSTSPPGDGFGWTTDEAKGVVYQVDSGGVRRRQLPDRSRGAAGLVQRRARLGRQPGRRHGHRPSRRHRVRPRRTGSPIRSIPSPPAPGGSSSSSPTGRPSTRCYGRARRRRRPPVHRWLRARPARPALVLVRLRPCKSNRRRAPALLRHVDRSESAAGQRSSREVAAAMPRVSPDGRTYTFTIRPGYRFSPPVSGEQVTAETFRASIERALSPGLGADTPGPRSDR